MLVEHDRSDYGPPPSPGGWRLALSGLVAEAARTMFLGEDRFPRRLVWNSASGAAALASRVAGLLPRPKSRTAWREVANKVAAYTMFASAARWLGERGEWSSLASAPERIRELDRYVAVWTMEGASYYYARRGGPLKASEVRKLPREVWLPVHTGAGLVWAEAALRSARKSGVERMFAEHWERCRREAVDGYHETVFEGLGLVAATLYPQLVPQIGRLTGASEEQNALFWHGVGRGLYFQPAAFLPWRAAQNRPHTLAQHWPASETARANLFAGLAWAMTLVNMREPEVVRQWLAEHGNDVNSQQALKNGMSAALVVWLEASPGDPAVHSLSRLERPGADQLSGDVAAKMFRLRPLAE